MTKSYKERSKCRNFLIREFQGLSRKQVIQRIYGTYFSPGLRKQLIKMIEEGFFNKLKRQLLYCEGYGQWVNKCPNNYRYPIEKGNLSSDDICLAGTGWCELSDKEINKNRGRTFLVTLCDLGIGETDFFQLWAESRNYRTNIGRDLREWIDRNYEEILEKREILDSWIKEACFKSLYRRPKRR